MKANKALHALATVALVCLGTCASAQQTDAGARGSTYGGTAPIPPEDVRAIENLIDDQGDLHFVISYPAQNGIPAHRVAFTHVEDHAAVSGTACTIVTRVMAQRGSIPAAHYRSVFTLSDVGHMYITTMSAYSSAPRGRPVSTNAPQNAADPEIQMVVLDQRNDGPQGIFMFRSIEPARRFFGVLQRVVPRCGGRNE
jgi:hypothetical protein